MSQLLEILQDIQKRPGMYFGDPDSARSIYVLNAFILGYQTVLKFGVSPEAWILVFGSSFRLFASV